MSDSDDAVSLLDYDEYEEDAVFDGEPQQQNEQQQQQQPLDDDAVDCPEILDTTLPAVELTKEERKKEKNREKDQKRREKKQERMVANAIAVAEGTKSRREVAEDDMRRRIEGIVSRERGRLRQEADAEIERRLAKWRADIESGKISIDRGITQKEKAERRERQHEHLRRRRIERQKKRRAADKGWAALGRHAVFGNGPEDDLDQMIAAELAAPTISIEEENPTPGPSRPTAIIRPRVVPLIDLRD